MIRGGGGIFYASTVQNTIGDLASLGFSDSRSFVVDQAETQSAFRLRDGVPLVPRPALTAGIGAVPPGQRPTTSIDFFNPAQVAPISYQYNLSVQREIARDLLAEVGYLANVSHHLAANDFSLNQVRPELMGGGTAQARRPFPQYSNVELDQSVDRQLDLSRRVCANREALQPGLILSRALCLVQILDDVASSDEYGDPGSYMDAYNRRLDKGRSGSDVPHRFV
ncbi:MAG: hypothetical protein WKF37_08920 [Bryobacteraceae bacterium]